MRPSLSAKLSSSFSAKHATQLQKMAEDVKRMEDEKLSDPPPMTNDEFTALADALLNFIRALGTAEDVAAAEELTKILEEDLTEDEEDDEDEDEEYDDEEETESNDEESGCEVEEKKRYAVNAEVRAEVDKDVCASPDLDEDAIAHSFAHSPFTPNRTAAILSAFLALSVFLASLLFDISQ